VVGFVLFCFLLVGVVGVCVVGLVWVLFCVK